MCFATQDKGADMMAWAIHSAMASVVDAILIASALDAMVNALDPLRHVLRPTPISLRAARLKELARRHTHDITWMVPGVSVGRSVGRVARSALLTAVSRAGRTVRGLRKGGAMCKCVNLALSVMLHLLSLPNTGCGFMHLHMYMCMPKCRYRCISRGTSQPRYAIATTTSQKVLHDLASFSRSSSSTPQEDVT